MKPDVFLRMLRDANALAPGTHEIARPLPPSERSRWKSRHPSLKLPNDFLGFLKRANGIRFLLDAKSPIGAAGRLFPLRSLCTVTELLYQDQEEEDEALPSSWMALSDDAEAAGILALDLRKRLYLEVDPENPEDAETVGATFEEALDWLASRYVPLLPEVPGSPPPVLE